MTIYYQDDYVSILHGDCREILDQYDLGPIHSCVTSPPYFGLRDYKEEKQIGLEKTPQEYVSTMVGVFERIRRDLRSDGTLWLNIGDSYAGSGKGFGGKNHGKLGPNANGFLPPPTKFDGLKNKDLIGIPWRTAFALQDAGWYLRNDNIWEKPNAMPSSVRDRCSMSHEYMFMLTKSARYYFDADAIAEPAGHAGQVVALGENSFARRQAKGAGKALTGNATADTYTVKETRNKRTVWRINTQSFKGAHFAVYPEKLIEPCIFAGVPQTICSICGAPWIRQIERKAHAINMVEAQRQQTRSAGAQTGGTQKVTLGVTDQVERKTIGWQATCTCNAATEPGVVIDPFGGAGTTGVVAKRFGRRAILIEQNESYCKMAAERIRKITPCTSPNDHVSITTVS